MSKNRHGAGRYDTITITIIQICRSITSSDHVCLFFDSRRL